GRHVPLEVSSRLLIKDGAPVGILGSARDISERRRAERMRDDFIASISHDLRSPLSTVKGLGQLALRQATRVESDTPEGMRRVEQLTDIVDAAARMGALIDDLLDLAQLEAGRPLDLALADVDLAALARRVAADHQKRTERHRISVEAAEPAVAGRWDPGR